jgi:hypothetical protein
MNNYITAYYLDEEDLLKGIKQMKTKGLQIADVLTPFPVHGIDKALGMPRSRLARVAFIGGAVGTVIGFGFQAWVFTMDYPLNIGGKPFFAVPSFMPVAFEVTVLFAAFSMVIAFLASNKLGPGSNNIIHDERITDDRFLVVVKVDEDNMVESIRQIKLALAEAGAEGITLKA